MKNYIFIDGSYFIFYRFHSLLNWYKLSHQDTEDISISLKEPFNNEEFREKFESVFISKLREIPKKLNIENPEIYIGVDCKRENIWRVKHYPEYKATRGVYEEGKDPSKFFDFVYKNDLFVKAFDEKIKIIKNKDYNPIKIEYLKYDCLEADDCISLFVKRIIVADNLKDEDILEENQYLPHDEYEELREQLEKNKNYNITIITSDNDYLQLIENNNIQIYNACYKTITDNSMGHYKKDLLLKIIMGDKSDNIKPIFEKCGKKTAEKLINNKKLFNEKLKDIEIYKNYLLNKIMIDFDYIPPEIKEQFYKKYPES